MVGIVCREMKRKDEAMLGPILATKPVIARHDSQEDVEAKSEEVHDKPNTGDALLADRTETAQKERWLSG